MTPLDTRPFRKPRLRALLLAMSATSRVKGCLTGVPGSLNDISNLVVLVKP